MLITGERVVNAHVYDNRRPNLRSSTACRANLYRWAFIQACRLSRTSAPLSGCPTSPKNLVDMSTKSVGR
jgi:hypothetical protein